MSMLDPLGILRILRNGVELITRKAVDFTGDGVTVTDDPAHKRTVVNIPGGGGGGGGVARAPGRLAVTELNAGANHDVGPSPGLHLASGLLIRTLGVSSFSGLVPPIDPDAGEVVDNEYHLTVVNAGPDAVTFTNDNAGSEEGQRVLTLTGSSVVVEAGEVFSLVWRPDESPRCWRLYTDLDGGTAPKLGAVGIINLTSGPNYDRASSPSVDDVDTIAFTVTGGSVFCGIAAPSDQTRMHRRFIFNNSGFAVTLKHNDAGNAQASSRVDVSNGGGDLTVQARSGITLIWMPAALSVTGAAGWMRAVPA